MIRKLLNWCAWCAGATVPPPAGEALKLTHPRHSLEEHWYEVWAGVIQSLTIYDRNRSCEFVYQAVAMHVCCQSITPRQARELLTTTFGKFEAEKAAGKTPWLDSIRLDALAFEVRHLRRSKIRRRVEPSKN